MMDAIKFGYDAHQGRPVRSSTSSSRRPAPRRSDWRAPRLPTEEIFKQLSRSSPRRPAHRGPPDPRQDTTAATSRQRAIRDRLPRRALRRGSSTAPSAEHQESVKRRGPWPSEAFRQPREEDHPQADPRRRASAPTAAPLDQLREMLMARSASSTETHGSALFERGETQSLVTCCPRHVAQGRADRRRPHPRVRQEVLCSTTTSRPSAWARPAASWAPAAARSATAPSPSAPSWACCPQTRGLPLHRAPRQRTSPMSNGSSSMASVCGGCLALMDAGVPDHQHLRRHLRSA